MTEKEVETAWAEFDWSWWELIREERIQGLYAGWLHSERRDAAETALARLLKYKTLGAWADSEYMDPSAQILTDGTDLGTGPVTYDEAISEDDANAMVEALVEAVPHGEEDELSLRHRAFDWVYSDVLLVADWRGEECAGRQTWIEALADHIGRRRQPDAEFVSALAQVFPGIAAFRLPASNDGGSGWGGDVTRWLVACDWLAERDGGSVADAIRTAIGSGR